MRRRLRCGTRHRPQVRGVRGDLAGAHRSGPARPVLGGICSGTTDHLLRGIPDGTGRPQHRRTCGCHRGRSFRPRFGDQGRIDAGTSDAHRPGWCDGCRGLESRQHRVLPDRGHRPRRRKRVRQLRGCRARRGDSRILQPLRRRGHRGPTCPDVPRVPFAVNGFGARPIRGVPVHPYFACAANSDAVQRDRHLDDRRRGDRSESLGPAHSVHRPVRRRSRHIARRCPPGACRGGTGRKPDWIGPADARVVRYPPRGSANAPPRTDSRRPGRFPAGAGAAVVRRSGRRLAEAIRR